MNPSYSFYSLLLSFSSSFVLVAVQLALSIPLIYLLLTIKSEDPTDPSVEQ